MNIFPVFQTILYTISTALLYPVVILLIFLSIWMVVYAGGFFAELIKRKQYHLNEKLADSLVIIYKKRSLPIEIKDKLPIHIAEYAKELESIVKLRESFMEEKIEDLLQRSEHSLDRALSKVQMIVKIGPGAGLMGTLIPMGTGLAGLSQGDMAQLSSSLILAFTTTVVGIGLGITAYFFSVVKQRWINEDRRHLALITEAMTRN